MLQNKIKALKLFVPLMVVAFVSTSQAQDSPTTQSKIWYGASVAGNLNFYSGTTQTLNSTTQAPTAFHKGFGIAPFASVLLEYRPHPIWGLMLNIGYDDRSASFKGEMAPCDCPETLKTKLTYFTFQPSLKITPFSSGFYLFVGGAYSFNLKQTFKYTQELQTDKSGEISDIKQGIFSTHIGAGFDIPLSVTKLTTLSPFISYHPYFGQSPRNIESWSFSTVRIGVALKFGKNS